jgi:hypothetical protein
VSQPGISVFFWEYRNFSFSKRKGSVLNPGLDLRRVLCSMEENFKIYNYHIHYTTGTFKEKSIKDINLSFNKVSVWS